jgi:hypothetical protein
MKFISPLLGSVAVKVMVDDVFPVRGILQRDLAEVVSHLYSFNIKPTIPEGVPAAAFPVIQLAIFSNGDGVTAQDTNLANAVLVDFLAKLNTELGYRFTETNVTRLFSSAVVAEFEDEFVRCIGAADTLQRIVNTALERDGEPYRFKRLTLGPDSSNDVGPPVSIEHLIPREFSIERRVNTPLEKNRFVCAAPLPIDEHLRLLEEAERAVLG